MRTRIKVFDENLIMKIFIQICLGLQSLHKRGIFHQDLSLSNVFLKHNYDVRIGDFGDAVMISGASGGRQEEGAAQQYEEARKKDFVMLGQFLMDFCSQNKLFKSTQGYFKKPSAKGTFFSGSNFSGICRCFGELLTRNEEVDPDPLKFAE